MNESVSSRGFEAWLHNNPDHRFAESTIKKYLNALKMVEKWMHITLPTPIFSVTSEKDFEIADQMIRNAPDFEAANSRGNGDLSAALTQYKKYLHASAFDQGSVTGSVQEKTDEWWPSLNEYDLGITADRWIELLSGKLTDGQKEALAIFHTVKDGATCSELAERFNTNSKALSFACSQVAKNVQKVLQCPLAKGTKVEKYWPILFVGRDARGDEKGNWVWKLRPELYDALTQMDIEQYLPEPAEAYWPTLDMYDPGITKAQWLALLPELLDRNRGRVLAMLYSVPEGATCLELGERYGCDYQSIQATCIALAKEVQKKTSCPLFTREDRTRYWTVLFVGRDPHDGEKGTWAWKLRPELYEALTELDIERYLTADRRNLLPPSEALPMIHAYITARGFTYSPELLRNFYLCLQAKPFVILAGTSGTGKTRLVRLFAEAIGAEYRLIPVRPDWSDSSDLFGHCDLNGQFIPGALLEFVRQATDRLEVPHIVCLDEMNLARVEYYLSDVLSVLETRDRQGERIVTQPLVTLDRYGSDEAARKRFGELCFPDNLYLVGTVNMDETTFAFSRKVLDRANTIEFSTVDLMPDFDAFGAEAQALRLGNDFLRSRYLLLKDCAEQADYVTGLCAELQALNRILQSVNAHVGYRVRDEIVFYMLGNRGQEGQPLLSEDEALDFELLQKLLPRLQGGSQALKDVLVQLFRHCAADIRDFGGETDSESMRRALKALSEKAAGCRYPRSAEKLELMVRRLEEDGFTSYWL